MGDLKYKYAFDEKGDIVSIEGLTKETSKEHTYKCIACGNELRPRAIDSKHRRAHFFHKGDVSCNKETYLHKLCKLHIKHKFENSDKFIISYSASKSCNNHNCKLRNYNCHIEHETNQVDLKDYYDTCTIETTVKGFVADLLLTNSKDTSITPILIEICITHPCEVEKRKSGLKIIEISINEEKDIDNLFTNDSLSENSNDKTENKIEFISFKRNIKEKIIAPITRFIYYPSISDTPFLCKLKCDIANYKICESSIIELNIINKKLHSSYHNYDIACNWLAKHTKIKCNDYSGNTIGVREDEYKIFEIKEHYIIKKDTYCVMIAGSNSFDNYTYFEEKCNHLLSEKINTHNIFILVQVSNDIFKIVKRFSYKYDLIVIPFNTLWGKYGPLPIEMYKKADALIAFWDGKSEFTKSLIEGAKHNGLEVNVVNYSNNEET